MSDAARDPDGTGPNGGGSALPSARDGAPPTPVTRVATGSAGRKGRGRNGRRDRARQGKPRPARDIGRPEAATPVELAVTEVEVELDGAPWIVRVLGRSGSVEGGRGAPLLLLGFAPPPAPGRTVRESLVVGRSLETLSEAALEEAFRVSRPSPPADGTRDGKRG